MKDEDSLFVGAISGEDPSPQYLEVALPTTELQTRRSSKSSSSSSFVVRLAYHYREAARESKMNDAIVFCGGFRSDMRGTKALFLQRYCAERKLDYCRFDYRGHGQSTRAWDSSSTEEELSFWTSQATIGNWISDALEILDRVVLTRERGRDENVADSSSQPPPPPAQGPPYRPQRRVILVGSSMGAWIALHVAMVRPHTVVGMVGLASAPDFTEDLWRRHLNAEQRLQIMAEGVAYLPSRYDPDHPYPITRSLIEEARRSRWLLFENETTPPMTGCFRNGITLMCAVHLLHGKQDEDVSYQTSVTLADHLTKSTTGGNRPRRPPREVRVTLVEDGDHRLSRPKDLKLLAATLDRLLCAVEAVHDPK
jgi:pimeloyl-ACP methyl ester carboxylesterase